MSQLTPKLGRVRYGASDLQRMYKKNMSIAMLCSSIITLILVNLLHLAESNQVVNGKEPERQIRIFMYTEEVQPPPIGDGNFGMTAYPVLPLHALPNVMADPAVIPDKTKKPGQRVPSLRQLAGPIGGLPDAIASEKHSDEHQSMHDYSDRIVPDDRNDIAGGSGYSENPKRKGGVPVPGKTGEPPSGFDRSGVGSSSRPTASGMPLGYGSGIDGEGGGEGYSLQWGPGLLRRKLSGALPKFPAGVTTGGQVQILATVQPDGSVKFVQPKQKVNAKLEEAAMNAVRTWKFEALPSTMAQGDQTCTIIFLFKLR